MTDRILATRTACEVVKTDRREFDLRDNKGRRFGYRVSIFREVFEAVDAPVEYVAYWRVAPTMIGESFSVCPHALRGGKEYGAIPVRAERRFATLEEAIAAAETMFANARKSATKKAVLA